MCRREKAQSIVFPDIIDQQAHTGGHAIDNLESILQWQEWGKSTRTIFHHHSDGSRNNVRENCPVIIREFNHRLRGKGHSGLGILRLGRNDQFLA